MLKKATRHLLLLNALVFILVLGVFSIAVYSTVTHNTDGEKRQRLQVLSDTLISSIESPEDNEGEEAVPDIVQIHGSKEPEPDDLTLQWFDAQQRLVAQKGLLKIAVPFDNAATFQTQAQQHALLLTRRVERDGRLIGYLRVGLSLLDADNYKRNLLVGLGFGSILALIISGIAVVWLVRQALKPVAMSMQKLSDFTGDASHELKSPIMAIKTNAAVALKYADGMRDGDREKMIAMLNAANQMQRTIEDLLGLAESEHQLPEEALETVSAEELLSEVALDLRDLAESREITIHCLVDEPALSLRVRKADIRLVLLNLAKNAIAYSRQGGEIWIRAFKSSGKIQFEVRDTGIGISEADLPRIFDRFWRSDKARSYTSGGNGLGLSIVKSIVDRYQGMTTVRSKLGEGTTVAIAFPERR